MRAKLTPIAGFCLRSISSFFSPISRVQRRGIPDLEGKVFKNPNSRSATYSETKPLNQDLDLAGLPQFTVRIGGDIGGRSPMSPPAISTVYCCVAKGTKVIYFYNSADQELETLAAECLEKAPDFHHWYFHTVGVRTLGFLMADGYTYFAIIDRSAGSLAVLTLLESLREAFRKSPRRDLHDELVSVIKHLVSSLEYAPPHSSEGSNASPSTNQPLLKDGMLMIDMPMQQVNLSSSREMIGYKLWWRHVKLIVSVDIILCLVLFSVWLAVCNGFHCVSKR